jgi:hypothetical protein
MVTVYFGSRRSFFSWNIFDKMVNNMNQSPRFTLDAQDKQRMLVIVVHGLIGIFLTLISEVFLKMNYGVSTPIITTALSLISLTLTQYLNGPSEATLKIQQLEELVQQLQPQNQNVEPPIPPIV